MSKKDLTSKEKKKVVEVYRKVSDYFNVNPYFLYHNTSAAYQHTASLRTRTHSRVNPQRMVLAFAYKIIKHISPKHELIGEIESVLPMVQGKYIISYSISVEAREQSVDLHVVGKNNKLLGIAHSLSMPYKKGVSYKNIGSKLLREALITQEQNRALNACFKLKQDSVIDLDGKITKQSKWKISKRKKGLPNPMITK